MPCGPSKAQDKQLSVVQFKLGTLFQKIWDVDSSWVKFVNKPLRQLLIELMDYIIL